MSVSNGQIANQTTFNNAFISRTADDNTIGKKDLQNTDPASGADVINVQREINSLDSFSGRTPGTAFDVKPSWTNNDIGASTDDLKVRTDAITGEFNNTTGHAHTGGPGEGGVISATDLADVPLRGFARQGTDITALGTSDDVTTEMTGKVPSSGSAVEGVVVTAPYNKVYIAESSTLDPIEDGSGNEVYGRITESAGTWTLTYYSNVAGTETSYSFASTLISWWYQELFSIVNPLVPVYSEEFSYPSDNATADVVDASVSQRGLVSTGTQSFAGDKTFQGSVTHQGKLIGDHATDSTTTGANQTIVAPSKSLLRITNAGLTSIDMFSSPVANHFFILRNATGATVNINNETGATAANRILTGTGANIPLGNDASIWLKYDNVSSRWVVIGGSGGGAEYRSGSDTISNGVATKAITYSSVMPNTNYSISAVIENTTDASPMFIPITITAKSTSGFTAKWNNNTDSANYVLEWSVTAHN